MLGISATLPRMASIASNVLCACANSKLPLHHPERAGRTGAQVVAGVNHILVLELKDEAGPKTVEVTVWEKLPSSVKANDAPMELTNFKLVGPAAEVCRQHCTLQRTACACAVTTSTLHCVERPCLQPRMPQCTTATALLPPQ